MRVINLDETGIKVINENKKQIYIPVVDLPAFVGKQYKIEDNVLNFNGKKLQLSEKDLSDLPNILRYIKVNFMKK